MIYDNTHDDLDLIRYPELAKRMKHSKGWSVQEHADPLGILSSTVTGDDKVLVRQVLIETTITATATVTTEDTKKDSSVVIPATKVIMP